MYKLMAVRDNNGIKEFGILDTEDYSVDFVDISVIRTCMQRKIPIRGISTKHNIVNGHTHKEIVASIQPYDIPKKIVSKVDRFLVSKYKEMCYVAGINPKGASDVLCDIYCKMAIEQQSGVNLLSKYKSATEEQLFTLTY